MLPRNRLGPFLPRGRVPGRFIAPWSLLAELAGNLIIGLGGLAHLIELDPFVAGVRLRDVTGPEDHARKAGGP